MIFRKAPNEKFLIYAQVAGMVFLLGFTLYVNGLDVLRAEWFKELFAK
jgi:regulator of sigma E protease